MAQSNINFDYQYKAALCIIHNSSRPKIKLHKKTFFIRNNIMLLRSFAAPYYSVFQYNVNNILVENALTCVEN